MQAIKSSLLTATLHKADGLDDEVEMENNHFEMQPLKTIEDLNQLEAEGIEEVESHAGHTVQFTDCNIVQWMRNLNMQTNLTSSL